MTTINMKKFTRSVNHAVHGLAHAFRTENNFRIHAVVGAIVFALAALWRLSSWQIMILVMVVAAMLILELTNTIVERFSDLLEPRVHPYIHVIKDLMASAVIIAAVAAVVVGLIIFGPYAARWWFSLY